MGLLSMMGRNTKLDHKIFLVYDQIYYLKLITRKNNYLNLKIIFIFNIIEYHFVLKLNDKIAFNKNDY